MKNISFHNPTNIIQQHHPTMPLAESEAERTNMIRKCDCCGAAMNSGYCIDDGLEYFCSDDCLHSTYSAEEYDELCSTDSAYWTEWEDENPYWWNIENIAKRQREKGIRTYGQGLEDNDLDISERLDYLSEELVDALMYIQWVKDKLTERRHG